jgi:hypothetical protein
MEGDRRLMLTVVTKLKSRRKEYPIPLFSHKHLFKVLRYIQNLKVKIVAEGKGYSLFPYHLHCSIFTTTIITTVTITTTTASTSSTISTLTVLFPLSPSSLHSPL